jgi:hypothetical protein
MEYASILLPANYDSSSSDSDDNRECVQTVKRLRYESTFVESPSQDNEDDSINGNGMDDEVYSGMGFDTDTKRKTKICLVIFTLPMIGLKRDPFQVGMWTIR